MTKKKKKEAKPSPSELKQIKHWKRHRGNALYEGHRLMHKYKTLYTFFITIYEKALQFTALLVANALINCYYNA